MKSKAIAKLINDAIKAAELEKADFSEIRSGNEFPTDENQVTDFIRRRVSLHHRTWIIGPLEEALKKIGVERI